MRIIKKYIYIYIQDNSSKIKTKQLQMRMIEKYLQKDIYISPEKRQKNIDNLRSIIIIQ